MKDPTTLLSTLTQAAAVFVAIVGGFLVSRLVAISSERDGLRRRYEEARDQLKHVTASYDEAHDYRLLNSCYRFKGWVMDDVIGVPPESIDREKCLEQIPRGSSHEEMAPYLENLIDRVTDATEQIRARVADGDTSRLTLDDLRERGLVVPDNDEDIYRRVARSVASGLPDPQSYGLYFPSIDAMDILNPVSTATDLRRLDESISQEQELKARMQLLETEVERLESEIALAGRPAGVTSALVILVIYSLLGIVAPVVVLTLSPASLKWWQAWGLVALSGVGLFAVLGYILWYARTLNQAVVDEEKVR